MQKVFVFYRLFCVERKSTCGRLRENFLVLLYQLKILSPVFPTGLSGSCGCLWMLPVTLETE